MRALIVVPVVALFGCAHEEAECSAAPVASATSQPQQQEQQQQRQERVAPAPQPAERLTASTCPLTRVHFAFDSDVVPDDQKPALDQAARCLKENRTLRVSVEGSADYIGPQAYNQNLGQRRARAVANYLRGQGVSAAQLESISFGEQLPICVGDDPECLAKNRAAALRPVCHM